jgi:hypothetical protein
MTVNARSNREMVLVSRTGTLLDASRLVGEHENGLLDPDAGAVP